MSAFAPMMRTPATTIRPRLQSDHGNHHRRTGRSDGQCYTLDVTYSANLKPGRYELIGKVDGETVVESNENDNARLGPGGCCRAMGICWCRAGMGTITSASRRTQRIISRDIW